MVALTSQLREFDTGKISVFSMKAMREWVFI